MPTPNEHHDAALPLVGWVLYDETCGLCRTWVPRWQRTLRRAGYEVAPLQADWVTQRTGLRPEELVTDFRLLRRDGQLISGVDAYRDIMGHLWWARPLAWLVRVWPLRGLFDSLYRRIAANRYRISRACRLDQ